MGASGILEREHKEIFQSLTALANRDDGLGRIAREVLESLRPHLEREEELVIPVLDALGDLALSGASGAGKPAEIAGRLSAEYFMMFREHEAILEKVNALYDQAKKNDDREATELGERLREHIALEETVLYPAALVAVKYAEKIIEGEIGSYKGLGQGEPQSFGGAKSR